MKQKFMVVLVAVVLGAAGAAFAAEAGGGTATGAVKTGDASSKATRMAEDNATELPPAPSAVISVDELRASYAAQKQGAPAIPGFAMQAAHFLKNAAVPQTETSAQRREWMALSLAAHGAAAFDAYSTRLALNTGAAYERDPLLKPFANSAAMYPATQVMPFGLDFLSRRMMRSQNSVVRRTWWVPQLASSVGSTWVGVRNLHVAQ